MSKQDILDFFSDINYAYNDSTRLDTLRRMLDELVEQAAQRWHRVKEPPKKAGKYAVCWTYQEKIYWDWLIFVDGNWVLQAGLPLPNYWMPIEPPKEDA